MEKSPIKKKKWFTAEEKAILHELVRLNSSVINTGRRKGVSVQAKKKAWQNITDIYNDHPRTITTRTVIELRRCWDCMKFYAKKRSENLAEFGDGDVCNIPQQVADSKNVATATHIQSQPSLQCLGMRQHILASILANDDASQQPTSILTYCAASEDHIPQQLQTSAEQDEKQTTGGVMSAANDDGASSKDEVTCSVKPVDPATASNGSDVSTTTTSQSDNISANNSSDSNSESNTALLKSLQQLQRSNQRLRSQVMSAEMQLLQQQQKQLQFEHMERMRRQQEEHEARLSALRQDLALKKIMFRVHACALQSEE